VTFGAVAGLASKKATAAIPIVATAGDPRRLRRVSTHVSPGRKHYGLALVAPQLAATVSGVETKSISGGTNRRRLRAYDFVALTIAGSRSRQQETWGCIHMKLAARIVIKEYGECSAVALLKMYNKCSDLARVEVEVMLAKLWNNARRIDVR
jgi:hypothetical protein